MKNTTKILFFIGYFALLGFMFLFFIWSYVMFAVMYSGGFLDQELEIGIIARIFTITLQLISLSFGFLLVFDMSKVVFKKEGINKRQLRRTFYFFLGSLALVTANYALLQNGISIFG